MVKKMAAQFNATTAKHWHNQVIACLQGGIRVDVYNIEHPVRGREIRPDRLNHLVAKMAAGTTVKSQYSLTHP